MCWLYTFIAWKLGQRDLEIAIFGKQVSICLSFFVIFIPCCSMRPLLV